MPTHFHNGFREDGGMYLTHSLLCSYLFLLLYCLCTAPILPNAGFLFSASFTISQLCKTIFPFIICGLFFHIYTTFPVETASITIIALLFGDLRKSCHQKAFSISLTTHFPIHSIPLIQLCTGINPLVGCQRPI